MSLEMIFDFNKLWYGICDALLQIVDALCNVFYWFAGIMPATQTNTSTAANGSLNVLNQNSLIAQVFSLSGIGALFFAFMIIGIACLGIAVAVSFVKTSFAPDQPAAKKKMLGNPIR